MAGTSGFSRGIPLQAVVKLSTVLVNDGDFVQELLKLCR